MDTTQNQQKIVRSISRKLHKAMRDYRLINNGDHILIGLSGGKDSLALVELLGERMKIFVPKFRLTAVHISVENIGYQSDLEYLKSFCDGYNIPFVHYTTRFSEDVDPQRSKCFLCSWHRRKALFDVATQLGCNKIALGHHQTDIVETLLLNMIYQGSYGTMPPLLKMDKFDMTIIRPLCLVEEEDLLALSELRGYHKQVKKCPYEYDSSRNEVKQLLQQLKQLNPNVCQCIWNAMENIKTQYLPQK